MELRTQKTRQCSLIVSERDMSFIVGTSNRGVNGNYGHPFLQREGLRSQVHIAGNRYNRPVRQIRMSPEMTRKAKPPEESPHIDIAHS